MRLPYQRTALIPEITEIFDMHVCYQEAIVRMQRYHRTHEFKSTVIRECKRQIVKLKF